MQTERDFFIGLSLESFDLSEPLSVSDLENTIDDLRHILADIERDVGGVAEPAHVRWGWGGDPQITMVASVNGASAEVLRSIVATTFDGFGAVRADPRASSDNWPTRIAPETRTRLHRVINRLTRAASVTVTATDRAPLVIDPESVTSRPQSTRFFNERASIDGRLDVINVHGSPHFVLFEHGTGRRIRCALPDNLLPRVKEGLQSRVVVEGLVRYREDGSPISIREVTSLDPVPPPSVDFRALRGALRVIPDDDESTGDYVRRLREANGDG